MIPPPNVGMTAPDEHLMSFKYPRRKEKIMKCKFSFIILPIVILALFTVTSNLYAQDMVDLLNQLSGKAEAPQRNSEELAQAYQKVIDYLLPLLSAENIGSRYNYQITLEEISYNAARPGAETQRQALANVMSNTLEQKEMPDTLRHWFVLQLERIGKGESVPVLAKFLSAEDKKLRDYARCALEENPDQSATDVLLKELSSANDSSWRIGLINSLGQRRAESAVILLTQALKNQDVKVAAAAITALSNIGNNKSKQALLDVIENQSSPIYNKAAHGLINIAQRMLVNKDTAGAAKIFEALYENSSKMTRDTSTPNPFNIRVAALNGMIICNPKRGTRELVNIIQDSDPKTRSLATRAARMSPDIKAVQELGKILSELEPDSQVQVLALIGDRQDISSISFVKGLLNSGQEIVRLAAIDTLSKLSDSVAVETLFEIAANGSGADQTAARDGLALMPGTEIEEIIKTKAASGDVKARVIAINLLGQRRIHGASESLIGYATDANENISAAAFEALVHVGDSVEITTLVELLTKTKSNKARSSGTSTLRSILAKAKDKDAAANIIIAQMETADSELKLTLLSTLNAIGGPTALKTVIEATRSTDETVRDVGIRTLSNWPDFEAVEILLDIASKSETSLTHYVLATRGALELIQTSNLAPLDDRALLCIKVFDNARRDEEKKQAISTMASLSSMKVVEKLLELVKNENFKEEAGLAAIQLATNMLWSNRQIARNLAQKIRDMDISDDINQRAENVINSRGIMFRGGRRRR